MSKKKITTRKVTSTKKTTATQSSAKSSVSPKTETPAALPFGRMNYILLLIGVGIIGLGFILMSMDDFIDATEFSISLYIAPLVVVAGFLEIIYAIMYKSKSQTETTTD
jgi:drug/metabolite transporter (DMT)-like permease